MKILCYLLTHLRKTKGHVVSGEQEWCQVSKSQVEASGEHPCGVCRKGVGNNSNLSVKWVKWVHKRCSGISGRLKRNVDFHYRRCLEGNHVLSVLLKEVVIEPNVKLECVLKFCYLGDTFGAGGSMEEACKSQSKMYLD